MVYLVREKNGKVKTWLSEKKVADFLAKKLGGTTEERLAISDDDGITTFIVDKEMEYGCQQATHDRVYGEEYEEHLKQLRLIVINKVRETLSDEEIELLRTMKN